MPELSNIQTFEILQDKGLEASVHKFQKILGDLDLLSEEIRFSLESAEWIVESNGFVYLNKSLPWLKYRGFSLRPSLMVYTKEVDESFQQDWVAYEFFLLTEEIIVRESSYLIDRAFLKTICKEMIAEFLDTGIYFTNEMQDGEDFDGIRMQDISKLWSFEYALIPKKLNHLYGVPSEKFRSLDAMEGEWQEYIRADSLEKYR